MSEKPWQEPGSTEHEQLQKIRSELFSALMRVPPGKAIDKLSFTWNGDGTIATLKAYYGSAELLFTLVFSWNVDGSLKEVARS